MSMRLISKFGFVLFGLLAFGLLWVVPYAAITGYRSGYKEPAKRWELLKRATTEKIEFDIEKMPPLSFDRGFPLVYKQFAVYMQDPRYRERVAENGAMAGGLVLTFFGGLAFALFLTRRSNQYGDARFGTLSEASDARLLSKQGLIVGKMAGHTLISNDPGHVLVVGPTRTGKGVSFVIPNGLTWGGSMVVLDIKGENARLFGQARAARGDKVFVFAPGSSYSHRYNPLDFVRTGPEMATDCANIAGFLVGGSGVENEWTMAARKVVGALLGYVMTSAHFQSQRYIRSAVRLISTGHDIANVLRAIVINESGGLVPQWVIDDFNQFVAIPDRTRGSVMFNVSNAFAPWSSELISAATQSSDFDIRALRRERMSIFIGTPLADLESYRPIVRILFQQIHDVLMREMPGAGERYEVLLLLDEFFALGKMSSLASKIAVSAGYGFKMAIILQNISQLDEIYGRATRETMVSGTAVKLFVAINDNETAKYVSNALGTYTATTTTKIPGLGFSQSRVSIGQMAAPLRRAEELTRMAADKSIVLVANARPFEVRKLFYYRSGSLKRLMARGKKVAVRIPKLRDWIDSPIWTDGARVELPSASQAAPVPTAPIVVFPKVERSAAPALKTASVAVEDKNRTSADLKRAEMEARPQISALNEEIEAKLATALSTIDEELGSAGPETVAPLKEARDKLEATAQRIRTEWVQA